MSGISKDPDNVKNINEQSSKLAYLNEKLETLQDTKARNDEIKQK